MFKVCAFVYMQKKKCMKKKRKENKNKHMYVCA